MEKKCLVCGTPFESKYAGKLYCSSRCRDIMCEKRQAKLRGADWQPPKPHIVLQNEGMTQKDWEDFKAAYRAGRRSRVYSRVLPTQKMLMEIEVRSICGYGITGNPIEEGVAGESYFPWAMLRTEAQYQEWRTKVLASGELKKSICQVCGCEFEHITPRKVCYDPDCAGINKKRSARGRKDIVLKGSEPKWRK